MKDASLEMCIVLLMAVDSCINRGAVPWQLLFINGVDGMGVMSHSWVFDTFKKIGPTGKKCHFFQLQ